MYGPPTTSLPETPGGVSLLDCPSVVFNNFVCASTRPLYDVDRTLVMFGSAWDGWRKYPESVVDLNQESV